MTLDDSKALTLLSPTGGVRVARDPHKIISPSDATADTRLQLVRYLKARRLPEALELTKLFLCSSVARQRWRHWLELVFVREGYLAELVEFLWCERETIITDLFALALFMSFSNKAGTWQRFERLCRDWSDRSPTFLRTFSELCRLDCFANLDPGQKADFCRFKYAGWRTDVNFLAAAAAYSEYVEISEPVTNYLFQERRDKRLSYRDWLHSFRIAEAIKHVSMDLASLSRIPHAAFDLAGVIRYPGLGELVHLDAMRVFFNKLDGSNGLMLATFHGAYSLFAVDCFRRMKPNKWVMGMVAEGGSNDISVSTNRHTAGFRGMSRGMLKKKERRCSP